MSDLPPDVKRAPGLFADVAPRWSHDGRRIAFLRLTSDRRAQLCVASADLASIEPLLEPALMSPDRPFHAGRAGYHEPDSLAWSPDDREIAFPHVEWFKFEEDERLPGTGLWECDPHTHIAAPLAIHPKRYYGGFYYYRSPQWSPDGKRIAFTGEGQGNESALFVRNLDGESPIQGMPRFDQFADSAWPVWSPDGRRLAFRQGILRAPTADPVETLRLIEPGGGQARRLFLTTPTRFASLTGTVSGTPIAPRAAGLAWSPDGKRLAFILTPDPLALDRYSVWVLDIEKGGKPMRVSPADKQGYHAPVWLDVRTLGALRTRADGAYDAVALPLRGGATRVLCRLPDDDADWSPDRSHIVCAVPVHGRPSGITTLRLYDTGYGPR